MAFTHTKKVDIGSFLNARIRISSKRSGSDRIRMRNTYLKYRTKHVYDENVRAPSVETTVNNNKVRTV
jgi:hypothetical protein